MHENRLDEENETRMADLGWLGGQCSDFKTGYRLVLTAMSEI